MVTPPEPEDAYSAWSETFAAILKAPGSTLILGGAGTGKTTFARLLANKFLASGERVAVLDADLGQSEIAPPACIGLALPSQTFEAFSDLAPDSLAFIGGISAVRNPIEHIASIGRLARRAAERNLIVDFDGYQHGANFRALFHAVCDMTQPAHIVALQRRSELASALSPLKRRNIAVHTPPVPEAVVSKPASLKKMRRAMKFESCFQNATTHICSFDETGLFGTWLGGGEPVPPHILAYISQTFGRNYRVYYAETSGQDLRLMLHRAVPAEFGALGMVLQHLKAKSVTLTVAPQLKHLLLGLEGGDGALLGLGLLEALDFRRRQFGVLTSLRSMGAVRAVRFGSLRLLADGTEIGTLPPNFQ